MPDFSLEYTLEGPVVGIDEAGCGPWAGPVMAGAAILFPEKLSASFLALLNDSKTLTANKRQALYDVLCTVQGTGAIWASGLATVSEIDRLNIRQAAMLAMRRAVEQLPLKPRAALVDGIVAPQLSCFVKTVKKGDSLSLSIAAASIIAKVERDQIMKELAQEFPGYGWEKNAGYGTVSHIKALQKFGITPHHRRSFQPIAQLLAAAA
jgi:ribonuclease HII